MLNFEGYILFAMIQIIFFAAYYMIQKMYVDR